MKINCIAVDDEPLALDIIRDYCSRIPFLNLLKVFDNAVECIDFLRTSKVELLFLDIQMEELSGIQLLNVLKQKPQVIFTTAYDSYALQGFELDVADYLLKPISFERFLKAVDKVYEKISASRPKVVKEGEPVAAPGGEGYIFVKTEYRLERVNYSDILYIEGMGDYLKIVTPTKKLMTLLNFRKVEEMLPAHRFFRVHKSYIIAIDKVENIERNRIKIADKLIPISDTCRKPFFDFLEKKKLV